MSATTLTAAIETLLWLDTATKDQVAERLMRAEDEAFLWHCVELQLSPDEKARFVQIAKTLRGNGYERPRT